MRQLLTVESVVKTFSENSGIVKVSFRVNVGERVGIVGETGSGKSTLLKIIGGLIEADDGTVLFEGERVLGPNEKLIAGHEGITYLSQHFELPKFISVHEYLHDPYLIAPEDAQRIYQACQVDHLLERDTSALSGGEKQRVALSKLLLKSPKLLLLDEPFSNLDFNHKRVIKRVLCNVEEELGITILLVVHDPKDVLSWAERILVFRNGQIIQEGSSEHIYKLPIDTYVAGLFGTYNLLSKSEWSHDPSVFTTIGDKIIVRPEQLTVSGNDNEGVPGRVVSRSYYGSVDEVLVDTRTDQVVIYSEPEEFKVGDKVNLMIKP